MTRERKEGVQSHNETDRPLEDGGGKRSIPSAVKLRQILGTSPTPRMLTPYEIELLRKSKQEIDQVVGEVLAAKRSKPQSCQREGTPLGSETKERPSEDHCHPLGR